MPSDTVTYPTPVQVNGFTCKNCNEVDRAARHVDPAHPRSGPNNVDAASDPTRNATDPARIAAARRAADAAASNVIGYSPSGVRTAGVSIGLGFSLAA